MDYRKVLYLTQHHPSLQYSTTPTPLLLQMAQHCPERPDIDGHAVLESNNLIRVG